MIEQLIFIGPTEFLAGNTNYSETIGKTYRMEMQSGTHMVKDNNGDILWHPKYYKSFMALHEHRNTKINMILE